MNSQLSEKLGLLLGGLLVLSGCTSASLRKPASTAASASSGNCVGKLCVGDTVWIVRKDKYSYLDRTEFSSDKDQGKIAEFFEDEEGNRALILLNNGEKIAAYPGTLLKEDSLDKPCSKTQACPGETVLYDSGPSYPSAKVLGYLFENRDWLALEPTEPGSRVRKIKLAEIETVYVTRSDICLKNKPEICIGTKIRNYNSKDDQILGAELSSLSSDKVRLLYQENEDPNSISLAGEDYILVRAQQLKEVTRELSYHVQSLAKDSDNDILRIAEDKCYGEFNRNGVLVTQLPQEETNDFKKSCSTKLVPPKLGADDMGPTFDGLYFVKICDVQWKVVCRDKRAK